MVKVNKNLVKRPAVLSVRRIPSASKMVPQCTTKDSFKSNSALRYQSWLSASTSSLAWLAMSKRLAILHRKPSIRIAVKVTRASSALAASTM